MSPGVALFSLLCHDRPAVSDRLDLDRLQALLRTEYIGRTVFYEALVDTTMELAKRQAEAGVKTIQLAPAEAKKWLDTAKDAGWAAVMKASPEHGPKLKELLTKK